MSFVDKSRILCEFLKNKVKIFIIILESTLGSTGATASIWITFYSPLLLHKHEPVAKI